MTAPRPELDVRGAKREARAAAEQAQIRIHQPVDNDDINLLAEAGDKIWGPRGTLAPNELRALAHAGDPLHLALDLSGPGEPVIGFAVGFLGWSPVLHVHSHQVGVVDGHRRRGVGYALKLAQRHTCLANGIVDMRWTFDPLIRRNAAFNLRVLGARATAFFPHFYGEMSDALNAGDDSDRLEAVWCLNGALPKREGPRRAATGSRGVPGPVLVEDRKGWPRATGTAPVPGAVMAVPADYAAIRRQDPDRGRAWREVIREVLLSSYAAGLRVGTVDEVGYALVTDDED